MPGAPASILDICCSRNVSRLETKAQNNKAFLTGNSLISYSPTPPERGSFPLDHDHECSSIMAEYLQCLKLVKGENAMNCRMLAKSYLKCRMDNELMDRDEWKNLGLPADKNTEETPIAGKKFGEK